MRKRPLLLMAVVYLLGICWSAYRPPLLATGTALLILVCMPRRGRFRAGEEKLSPSEDRQDAAGDVGETARKRTLYLLVMLLVFVAGVWRMGSRAAGRQETLGQLEDGETVTVQGTVIKREQKSEQLICELEEVWVLPSGASKALNGGRVRVCFSSDIYPIGTILIIEGKINMFSEAANEGAFDQRQFYRSQGIWLGFWDPKVLAAFEYGDPETPAARAGTDSGFFSLVRLEVMLRRLDYRLREQLAVLRQQLLGVLGELMNEENAGVLAGMLIGDRNQIDAETKLAYRNAGISHINAISALHISIFAMSAYRLLRKRGAGLWGAALVSGALIRMYGIMTGSSLSTERAVAMFWVMTLGVAVGRSYDMLNALGGWMLLALWENPFLIGYSGFVFSAAAVMGIGVTVRILESYGRKQDPPDPEEMEGESVRTAGGERAEPGEDGLRGRLWKALVSGIGVQLTTLPVVAYYYYEIPTYAVFLNLLVIPLMPVVLVSGAAGVAVGSFWLFPGRILIFPADRILSLYRMLCDWTLLLPRAQVIVGRPSVEKLVVYYAGLGFLLWRLHRARHRSLAGRLAVSAGLLSLVAMLYRGPALREEVDILDVGQGLGVYFATADGHTFFIDGGSTSENNVGTFQILPFLKSKGIRRIDYWCVSHADLDHISGAEEVFAAGYSVKWLVLAEAMPRDEPYSQLAAAARENGTELMTMRTGQRLVMGEEELVCLFPGERQAEGREAEPEEESDVLEQSGQKAGMEKQEQSGQKNERKESEQSNTSTVDRNKLCLTLLLRANAFSCLFPGDLSSEEEQVLLDNPLLAQVDLYVAAHHGSRYSNSKALLAAIRPKIAAVSCSLRNHYGHPGAEAVANMEEAGAELYYTMYSGQIRLSGREGELSVWTIR